MTDILQQILASTRAQVEEMKQGKPFAALDEEARRLPAPRSFVGGLRAKTNDGGIGLICEIKRASPSAGVIRPNLVPGEVAQAYADAGAACLSVLTENAHFQGNPFDLLEARASCPLPVLRKDFMLDIWQIAESRAIGADCILLIMAALDDELAADLSDAARAYKMDVLVEVHNEAELDRALKLSAGIIGINNRDLKTLQVDIAVTERLAKRIPADRTVISESGIGTAADITRLRKIGVHCFLVGESLLKQKDIGKAVSNLLGE